MPAEAFEKDGAGHAHLSADHLVVCTECQSAVRSALGPEIADLRERIAKVAKAAPRKGGRR